MRKIKIAQIGSNTNSHAVPVFKSLAKQTDVFDIVGYCLPENEEERLPDHLETYKDYKRLTLEEILNDPEIEAVAIETDEIYLTKYAIMAAEHNKHIHMEKPGTFCLEEFEKLISIMKKTKKVFHTGYMYRYNPYVKELMAKVKSGELGDIISVEAQMNCSHKPEVRKWLNDFPGGMMFFLGCHLIDLILQIKGKPKNIIPFNKSTGKGGIESKDFAFAVLEYDNAVCFAKTCASERGGFFRRQLVVSGTEGTVELKPFEICVDGGQYTGRTEYYSEDWHLKGTESMSDFYYRFDDMLHSFARMVVGEIENPYTYDYELELFKTVLKWCE
jgi:predicted dehydrogenase